MKTKNPLLEMDNLYFLYETYNSIFFGGELPNATISIIRNKKILGCFEFEISDGMVYNPQIKISDSYLFDYKLLEDTLVHEMIHFYLAFIGVDLKISHGTAFLQMAKDFNEIHETDIKVITDSSFLTTVEHNNWLTNLCQAIFL